MEEKVYRVYVTDLLAGIFNKFTTENSQRITERYYDLISPKRNAEREKTGDEIAAEIILKFGLKQKGNEE